MQNSFLKRKSTLAIGVVYAISKLFKSFSWIHVKSHEGKQYFSPTMLAFLPAK